MTMTGNKLRLGSTNVFDQVGRSCGRRGMRRSAICWLMLKRRFAPSMVLARFHRDSKSDRTYTVAHRPGSYVTEEGHVLVRTKH